MATKVQSQQLRLFALPGPWQERFGAAFFRRIPPKPGVYYFGDAQGRLIYVGKAVNLRRRINSYKHLAPDAVSRKTARLLQQTRAISWEILPDATAALLRENELLRLHRPRFNRLNTHPEQYVRVSWDRDASGMACLRWGRGDRPPDGRRWFGVFKGGKRAQEALRALGRLCWFICAKPEEMNTPPPALARVPLPGELLLPPDLPVPLLDTTLWEDYLAGRSDRLVAALVAALPPDLPPWWRKMAAGDAVVLREFFQCGPSRLRRLCQLAGVEAGWLEPAEVDDLLALEQARPVTARGKAD